MAYNNYGGQLLDAEPPKDDIRAYPNTLEINGVPPEGMVLTLIGRYDEGMAPDGGLLFSFACPASYKINTAEMAPKGGNNDIGYTTYEVPSTEDPAQRSPSEIYFQVRYKQADLAEDDFSCNLNVELANEGGGKNTYVFIFTKKRTGGGMEMMDEADDGVSLSPIQGNTRVGSDQQRNLNAFPTTMTVTPPVPDGMGVEVVGWLANTVETMTGIVMKFTAPAGRAIDPNRTGSSLGADDRTYDHMVSAIKVDESQESSNSMFWEVWYLKTDTDGDNWATKAILASGESTYKFIFIKKRTGGELDV